ncbi:MAG: acyl-CoA dehydrogenase [Candidatus Zixiibacteriota bacterium]|nr:MAG: acyl-CoA dehydrogenase [candidate division Zixibacteria bacterium]
MPIPDLYRLDELFTEEQRLIQRTVRDFVDEKILPGVRQWNRDAVFPVELIPEMAALGLLGATIQGWGCAGVDYVAYGLIAQELERGDSGFRSFVSVQNGLSMYPLLAFGSEEQKDRWLPPMARGEVVGCFALTEPDFGSDPGGLITQARRTAGGWVLNGVKRWSTNATIADLAVIWAKDEAGVIRGFLVEKGTPGMTAPEITGKLSLRVSVSSEVHLDDCHIPAENALPGAVGLKTALMCLNQARYSIAWGAVGAALACFEEAVEYAQTRIQFDRPIAGFQLVQAKLARMWTEITNARLLVLRLGQMMDQGKAHHAAVSMAKRYNVQTALETARTCRDLLGASGIVDDYHVFRHMANLESVYTYEGTHDIHTLILGQELTGLAAYA